MIRKSMVGFKNITVGRKNLIIRLLNAEYAPKLSSPDFGLTEHFPCDFNRESRFV